MNTTNLLSVRFFIKQYKVKNGCAPIYVRICVEGKPADVSLKRSIDISNWNAKKGQAQGLRDETKPINGRLLEIQVLDHIIVTIEGYYSFADEGILSASSPGFYLGKAEVSCLIGALSSLFMLIPQK